MPVDSSATEAPRRIRRIATEEAFSIPEIADALRLASRVNSDNLDLKLVRKLYDPAPGTPPSPRLAGLLDLEDVRIRDMDANGVDMEILSLTSPGVQMFDPATAVSLARIANDRLAETIARHPTRFAGLATFSPQDPAAAAKEMERAIKSLGLNGFIVNSHTNNEYLDEQKFWPILEAAEALDAPIYIHPRAPSDGMAAPFRDYGIETAMWGYMVETGTHAVRLLMSGAFERFPKLKIILGHMGEGIPFWLTRMDYMAQPHLLAGRGAVARNKEPPSFYFKRNFAITTSGVESHPALKLAIEVLGIENVMWAIDYPYQETPPAVAFMDSAPVTEAERAMLYHGNAERIFRIAPAEG